MYNIHGDYNIHRRALRSSEENNSGAIGSAGFYINNVKLIAYVTLIMKWIIFFHYILLLI